MSATVHEAGWTPIRVFVLAFGVVYTLVGILGWLNLFLTGVDTDAALVAETGELLGIFAVDPVHNIVHIAAGLVGIGAASRSDLARYYALGLGIVLLLLAAWGFALVGATGTEIDEILGLVSVNPADNWLHLLSAAALLALGSLRWAR